MPPKKQPQAGSSKVKEDKTFGMKNKNKSAKVKQEVARIQAQAAVTGKSRAAVEKEKEQQLRAKGEARGREAQERGGRAPPTRADAESPVRCRSEDGAVKVEKKNLYEDSREDKLNDTMDTWDQEKLAQVVLSKAGNPRTTTDVRFPPFPSLTKFNRLSQIVCKHFIQAIETQKFGWFWECPNGDQCQYRHALPPGFVLKSQRKAAEEAAKANVISLEEFLEVERHKLGTNLTPVTPESFAIWKKTRMDKKEAEQEALRKAKEQNRAAGKSSGMSGKDLFEYNPEWFEDEDEGDASDDWDLQQYRKQKEDEDAAAEAKRIADLSLHEGLQDGGAEGSGGGRD
ncbi:hypothetical protein MVEN_02134600 [Mycena venus]|uniref:C3H1-type domain-containing protein n=1 Tax=Mycena venus TaxID=2733690 RepID=A0A8H6XAB7_9AGAR|nr:hypothetical protein MVEN_02134600 [Mycena venus]